MNNVSLFVYRVLQVLTSKIVIEPIQKMFSTFKHKIFVPLGIQFTNEAIAKILMYVIF